MSADAESTPRSEPLENEDGPQGLNGDHASENDGDLFGDEDDDEVNQGNDLPRKLDDSDLDSGDDEGRADRIAATVEDEEELYEDQRQLKLLDVDMVRVKPPEGDELYLLNMPPFLGIKHRNFVPATYETPEKPHDGRDPATDPTAKFSPFSTAASSIFWRRDPRNPELLQSNSRIVRWSDGSLTLQIASSPKDHYRISTTALRQGWPKKPGSSQQDYDPNKDTHNYLAAPHATEGVDLQIVRHFDATMKIQPTGDLADESVLKLQQSLAAATQMHDPLATLKQVKEDPELAKKAAEMFEKERSRANRKREAAEDRLLMRRDRVLGSGLGRSGGGGAGLSIAGLEDDDGMPVARGTKAKASKRRKINRRGDIYSDDEDEDMPRGRGQDEYDREDDFLAASDEEPEIYDDGAEEVEAEDDSDPDVDDLEIEGRETVLETRTRGGNERHGGGGGRRERDRDRDRASTPKRSAADDDADADADESTAPRALPKKRRVVDDDDDDDE